MRRLTGILNRRPARLCRGCKVSSLFDQRSPLSEINAQFRLHAKRCHNHRNHRFSCSQNLDSPIVYPRVYDSCAAAPSRHSKI